MGYGVRALFEAQRSETAANIAAAAPNYTQIGANFLHPIRQLTVQNLTDALLQFSIDGVVDAFPLPANGLITLDFTANEVRTDGLFISKANGIWVKEIGSPTTGSVYVSAMYGKGD